MNIDYSDDYDARVQNSLLQLPNGSAEIDEYGNFVNLNDFVLWGHLSQQGIADMLPKYLEFTKPEQD